MQIPPLFKTLADVRRIYPLHDKRLFDSHKLSYLLSTVSLNEDFPRAFNFFHLSKISEVCL